MPARRLALLSFLLFVPACAAPPARRGLPEGPAAGTTVRVGTTEGGRVVVRPVPLEEYVEGSILSEFAPSAGREAVVERMLEVQAVIARTYAAGHLGRHGREGYDLCDRTHCQLYQPSRLRTSRWAPQAHLAVQRTGGRILWFRGAPALVVYHADCGGRTSAAADVWGGTPSPYLRGRADDGPAKRAHAAVWDFTVTPEALLAALNADPRTRVGAGLTALQVRQRDAAGRIHSLELRGADSRIVSGETFRDAASRAFGPRSIRSTWFDVRRQAAGFVFDGRGFGHGVGLCQAGALARIAAGGRIEAVLRRYFPGTRLAPLGR